MPKYSLEPVAKGRHRAVAFLVCSEKGNCTAKDGFTGFSVPESRRTRTSFDWWVADIRSHATKTRYHGWDSSTQSGKWKNCQCFKESQHRLYGFIARPKGNLRFQLCVLVVHATKAQHHTDDNELKRVLDMAALKEVQQVIDAFFEKLGLNS